MIEENKTIDEARQGEPTVIPSNPLNSRKLFLESYGCAMNFSDSEIVASILAKEGFSTTRNVEEADLVLINTCSIRDKAEQRIRTRLRDIKKIKKTNKEMMVGVIGCMAERIKQQLLDEEKLVDMVVGPDAYRELPALVKQVEGGQKAVNVLLSREETYADISPVRLDKNGVTAFISIMRGCDNMCSFCVVPFTRGRERSRSPQTILEEAKNLFENGYREVTLLGQNVDSFKWNLTAKGEVKNEDEPVVRFAGLLEMIASELPQLRIRFSTSHPKDMTEDVIHAIVKYDNICNYIHLPIQSGNSAVLKRMNRGYTREWYLNRIQMIRDIAPEMAISTDIITGFCGETDEEFEDTMSLMKEVRYDLAYMFKYSERPKTLAERKYEDDVPEKVKQERLARVIDLQLGIAKEKAKAFIGKTSQVLIEGISKKSKEEMHGRNSENFVVVFPKKNIKMGQYVNVKITEARGVTLRGEVVE